VRHAVEATQRAIPAAVGLGILESEILLNARSPLVLKKNTQPK
jgi:hypothetical protein